jgi:hypothetical protein
MAMQSADSTLHPLKTIVDTWLAKIDLAYKQKNDRFQKWADESMKFFDGAHDWMWQEHLPKAAPAPGSTNSNQWMPMFRMTYNRMFEAVALLGPSLYFRNPSVTCTPHIRPQIDPSALGVGMGDEMLDMQYQQIAMQDQMDHVNRTNAAQLYEALLNWLQLSTNKKIHVRQAITDALIKGAGYLWCSVETPKGSQRKIVRSSYINADDILKDPDATQADDVTWVARKCCHPVNIVEEKYGLPPGTLKGHIMSFESQASKGKNKKPSGADTSYDLVEYYEIYSKNGFGQLLKGNDGKYPIAEFDTSAFGSFTYLAVAKGVPFPLNMPSDVMAQGDMEDILMRAQWPIPFWQDEPTGNGWPFVELGFYDKPGSVWPVSIFKPVAGEMRFINWCMSFLADKAASSCQTIVARAKSAGAEIQSQLQGGSAPYTVIELSDLMGQKVSDVISFLNAPAFPADIWNVIAAVDDRIDKRLGLTELMYGLSTRQMRSAAEANVKDQAVSIRPDDMAHAVEDFVSSSNMKEAEAARFHMAAQDIAPVVGTLGAYVWDSYQRQTEPDDIVHSFSFRIEAGSARKPNKAARVEQLSGFAQYAMPLMSQFAAQGHTGPWNALMNELGKAMEIDPANFLLDIPPPQQQGPTPEQQAAQAEMEMKAQEQQIGMESQVMQMQMDQERHDQEMEQDKEKHEQQLKNDKAKANATRSKK